MKISASYNAMNSVETTLKFKYQTGKSEEGADWQ